MSVEASPAENEIGRVSAQLDFVFAGGTDMTVQDFLQPDGRSNKAVLYVYPGSDGIDFSIHDQARLVGVTRGLTQRMKGVAGLIATTIIEEHRYNASPIYSRHLHRPGACRTFVVERGAQRDLLRATTGIERRLSPDRLAIYVSSLLEDTVLARHVGALDALNEEHDRNSPLVRTLIGATKKGGIFANPTLNRMVELTLSRNRRRGVKRPSEQWADVVVPADRRLPGAPLIRHTVRYF